MSSANEYTACRPCVERKSPGCKQPRLLVHQRERLLGATVANRWFVERRGLVLGIFGAAASAGQLVAVPALMWLVAVTGWRQGTVLLAGAVILVLLPVLFLMRDDPSLMGLRP